VLLGFLVREAEAIGGGGGGGGGEETTGEINVQLLPWQQYQDMLRSHVTSLGVVL